MNNKLSLALMALFAAAAIGLTACAPPAEEGEPKTPEKTEMTEGDAPAEDAAPAAKTIVDVASENADFSTLVSAVTAAELVDTLKGDGPFTVFAPNNAAFEKVEGLDAILANKEQLTAILTYHVVPGKVMAADVKAGDVATVNGANIAVTVGEDGTVMLNGTAKVITTDVEASNGVIHVIDTVIVPPAAEAAPAPAEAAPKTE